MLDRVELERWLFGTGTDRRRVQDSPILPDVWYAYGLPLTELAGEGGPPAPLVAESIDEERRATSPQRPKDEEPEVDVLLRPAAASSSSDLAHALDQRITRARSHTRLAYNDAYVACRLTFGELIRDALPLTEFWQKHLWPGAEGPLVDLIGDRADELVDLLSAGTRMQGRRLTDPKAIPGDVVWLVGLIGRIAWEHQLGQEREKPTAGEVVEAAYAVLGDLAVESRPESPVLWTVSRNRPVRTSVWRSRVACKADAATRLFGLSCSNVCWAVIDSGIDARHPAFARRKGDAPVATNGEDDLQTARSRILGTWDFSKLRDVLVERPLRPAPTTDEIQLDDPEAERVLRIAQQVTRGRTVDWEAIAPKLQVRHGEGYDAPVDDHGTHVAGILIGDWREQDDPSPGKHDLQGMCPDMEVYDLRAFDAKGTSDEFQILSAMQFVRHLNAHADAPAVHGVNLSFSVQHDVDKYAAGGTPVCEEAHRLIGSGVVVVAAAGNDGRSGYMVQGRTVDGFRTVSITDPGNAEKVITVGATHRDEPHTYGVSYFSSRGPTGDGRAKPDLVAPGEKITSTIPGAGLASKDGTSQATPHVSGACALLLARHPELIGQPELLKQILVDACTDLGRERYFQGAGMLDVLRAIQAV